MAHVRILVLIVVALSAAATLRAEALGPPPDLASLVGEKLEFRVRWGVVPAARATLEVLPAGAGRLRLRAKARTLPYINTVYPVRSQVESTLLLAGAVPLRYAQRSKEGWNDPREIEVLFDAERGIAERFRDERPKRSLLVPPGVQDPLSCFYVYRTLPVPADGAVTIDVTDGKRLITGSVAVLGRETVTTPAGTFATVVIEPRLEGIGGIFKKSPGARIFIWLTDDRWRRPVKLQSEVVVGHFTAELTALHHPGAYPPDP